jgi:hypothetical protein
MKPVWIAALVIGALGLAGGGYLVGRGLGVNAKPPPSAEILPCGDPLRETEGGALVGEELYGWCTEGHRFARHEGAWAPAPKPLPGPNEVAHLPPWQRREMLKDIQEMQDRRLPPPPGWNGGTPLPTAR